MRTDALAIATLEQYAVHLSHRQRIQQQKNVPGSVIIQITGIAVCARADAKAFDDAIVALYQNGERLMPGNGYPMRLFLPGWEGNMNIKYLRRIKLTEGPAQGDEARLTRFLT